MRLAKLRVKGFRNLEGEIEFPSVLTLVVGENNSGKSNVIDALRLITRPRAGKRFSLWIGRDDFRQDSNGNREVDTFEITACYTDLSIQETGRMVACLTPSQGKNTAQMRLVARLDHAEQLDVEWYGGDSMQPNVERWARDAVQHTYLHPLRDAATDLRPGRDNKLVQLLSALAPETTSRRVEIESVAAEANQLLDRAEAVTLATKEIQERLTRMSGSRFAQKARLRFADQGFDRVVSSLKALVGESSPRDLANNGLGFNNLLYMATLLAALDNDVQTDGTHLLLVEEPEAHLHPQLQDLLLRYLESEAKLTTQVVVTTHSPNFAAASGVERMIVMLRAPGLSPVARCPANFGLDRDSLDHLKRFLDVTKASLLFARALILVEGIAEQLLLPQLAERLGIDLNAEGITVLSVGGVSFGPFARLFASNRLDRRCAIVTDGDPQATEDELALGTVSLSDTARKLKAAESDTMHVFLSQTTFEWDLVAAGNWDSMISALELVKPRVAVRLKANDPTVDGDRAKLLLAAVEDVKGRYAQALAQVLADGRSFNVPSYLSEAIKWAAGR